MTTAFVIRDYPDLDHIIPIIYKFLLKKKEIVIINFEINLNIHEDFRIKFLESNFKQVKIISIYSYLKNGLIRNLLSKIFSYRNFEVNFKNLKFIKNTNLSLINFLFISLLKKLFFSKSIQLERFVYNKNLIIKILKELNIKLLLMDDSLFWSYDKGKKLAAACQESNIRVDLFPHTCFIFDAEEESNIISSNNLKNFYPNLITNSIYHKNKVIKCGLSPDKIFILGSGRFSPEWLDKLKVITNCKEKNINKKLEVLIFEGVYNNQILEKKLIESISKIQNINLTVKVHPRGKFSNNQKNYQSNNSFILDFDTPSTNSIFNSDIIIGTFSSVLLDAFILNKAVIFPEFLCDPKKIDILYKDYNFTINCKKIEDVIKSIENFDNGNFQIDKKNRDRFMQDFAYGNNSEYDILNDYINFFEKKL